MEITVNGQSRELPDGLPVLQLVTDILGQAPERGLAIAVNDQVLSRPQWATTALGAGDTVEVVGFVGGG